MAWAMVLSALVGAGGAIYGGKQSAGATDSAAKRALDQQREDRNIMLSLYEPNRALGYGAASDLASLYGWNIPEYQSLDDLVTPTGGTSVNLGKHASAATGGAPGAASFAGPIAVNGRRAEGGNITDAKYYGGSRHRRAFGGTIDPLAGTVDLANIKSPKKEARLESAAAAYLRGETDTLKGKKNRRIRSTIDAMREAGYTYDPNAATATPEPEAPTAGPVTGGTGGTSADGTAGNFARFFTSPDFQFRLNEGNKAIERSAAARGGLFSGQTGKALTRFSQDTASSEYGNYVNRLLAAMGMGSAATSSAGSAVNSTGANMANTIIGAGNSRASSYSNMANGVAASVNQGLENWMLSKYLGR